MSKRKLPPNMYQPRKGGPYYTRYRGHKGKLIRTPLSKDFEVACQLLREVLMMRDRARLGLEVIHTNNVPLWEVWRRFKAHLHEKTISLKKRKLQPQTITTYERYIPEFIKFAGVETVAELTLAHVKAFTVLRETSTTRLVFRPKLVENPHDTRAAVHGFFLYQRKGPDDGWRDTETISLTSLKKDEGYRLELHAAEVLKLYTHLQDLYALHSTEGVPQGEAEFFRADQQLPAIAVLPREQWMRVLEANAAVGSTLLTNLLAWATAARSPQALVERVLRLCPQDLQALNTAVNVHRLKAVVEVWKGNQTTSKEEFWQELLTLNTFMRLFRTLCDYAITAGCGVKQHLTSCVPARREGPGGVLCEAAGAGAPRVGGEERAADGAPEVGHLW